MQPLEIRLRDERACGLQEWGAHLWVLEESGHAEALLPIAQIHYELVAHIQAEEGLARWAHVHLARFWSRLVYYIVLKIVAQYVETECRIPRHIAV